MWRISTFLTILRVKKWKCVYEEPKNARELLVYVFKFGMCWSNLFRYVHAKDYYYYLESKYTCLHPERAKLGILCTRTDNPLS